MDDLAAVGGRLRKARGSRALAGRPAEKGQRGSQQLSVAPPPHLGQGREAVCPPPSPFLPPCGRQVDRPLTLARGARQLVVHDALETMKSVLGLYFSSFTPMTYMGASAEGAEMTTRLAPPVMCAVALAMSVKTPVDSTT